VCVCVCEKRERQIDEKKVQCTRLAAVVVVVVVVVVVIVQVVGMRRKTLSTLPAFII